MKDPDPRSVQSGRDAVDVDSLSVKPSRDEHRLLDGTVVLGLYSQTVAEAGAVIEDPRRPPGRR
jgi:hypothetical protein